jgi:ACR3 family arsenite transporter
VKIYFFLRRFVRVLFSLIGIFAGMGFFEKYLSLWVLLCILAGIGLGYWAGDTIHILSDWNVSTVNVPVAILVWLMIYPMMVQIDFSSLAKVSDNWRGLGLTSVVNWFVKPFTMAFFGWIFFYKIYGAWLSPEDAEQYLAGAILLGAAPCTAMVFVWSYLTKGDANYTLVQVSVNDLILLVLFIPIVGMLFAFFGITVPSASGELGIPYEALATSVVVFVVFPLVTGYLSNRYLRQAKGEEWFKNVFLAALKPWSTLALLTTLILLFAFQGEKIVQQPGDILLIAVPLTLQTYFIFFLSWFVGKYLRLAHSICAPGAMIAASNFFELAVAVAISIFGLNSGASLATVVGVLIEVPVMLSLVAFANKWKYT